MSIVKCVKFKTFIAPLDFVFSAIIKYQSFVKDNLLCLFKLNLLLLSVPSPKIFRKVKFPRFNVGYVSYLKFLPTHLKRYHNHTHERKGDFFTDDEC